MRKVTRRVGFHCSQRGIEPVNGRAILADGIVRISQIDVDVRVIERAAGADAFELANTYLNPINARIILKMWHNPL